MKASTKDRVEGKFHEAKGAVKEKVGSVTGNPDMEVHGRDEKNTGKLQNRVGQAEKAIEK